MSKKDYILLARALYAHRGQAGHKEIATRIADELAVAYPTFKRDKFLFACGV